MQPPYTPGPPGGGYGPPPGGFAPPGGIPPQALPPQGPDAASQVNGPAIALMVVTGMTVLFYLGFTAVSLFAGGMGFLMPSSGSDPLSGMLGGVFAALIYGVFAIFAGVAFVGALRMKQLRSYNFAMTAAIIAIVPCTTYICCILATPLGIWALVVLMKPEVKAAFR